MWQCVHPSKRMLHIGPIYLGYISFFTQWESVRLVLCPVNSIFGHFSKLCCVRFQRGVAQTFATGAKNPFSTIHIFDFELNRLWMVGLRSKHSPTMLAGLGKFFIYFLTILKEHELHTMVKKCIQYMFKIVSLCLLPA